MIGNKFEWCLRCNIVCLIRFNVLGYNTILKICITNKLQRRTVVNLITLLMSYRMKSEIIFLLWCFTNYSPHRELIRFNTRNQACPAHTSRDECGLPKELTVSDRRFNKLKSGVSSQVKKMLRARQYTSIKTSAILIQIYRSLSTSMSF
jgi:hypothetical protein